jgi:hypothetical protein
MIERLKQHLLASWPEILPKTETPKSLALMQQRRRDRVLWLGFEGRRASPTVFIKMMRWKKLDQILGREKEISDRVIPQLGSTSTFHPTAAGSLTEIDGRLLLARPWHAGSPFDSAPRSFASNWALIKKINAEINARTQLSQNETVQSVSEEFERFIDRGGAPGGLDRWFHKDHLPTYLPWGSLAHGDLGGNNIVRSETETRVIDWEFAAEAQPPFYDWLYFPIHWLYFLQGNLRRQHITADDPTGILQYLFNGDTRSCQFINAELTRIITEESLPKDYFLFLICYSAIRQINLSSSGIANRDDIPFFTQLLNAVLNCAEDQKSRSSSES